MSHIFEVTDEQYRIIEKAARQRGQTPDALFAQLIQGLRDPLSEPRYYQTDDWMRHLGVSEERIQRINAEAEDEAEDDAGASADADAR